MLDVSPSVEQATVLKALAKSMPFDALVRDVLFAGQAGPECAAKPNEQDRDPRMFRDHPPKPR
jgi:hypothetical protein